MKDFMDKMNALAEVDTGKAQPLFHTWPVINIYREDKREEAIPRDEKKLPDGRNGVILPGILEFSVGEDGTAGSLAEVVRRLQKSGGELGIGELGEWDVDFSVGTEGNEPFAAECMDYDMIFIKPTAGLVSRYGLVTAFPSLEGPAIGAKNTEILSHVLEAAAGVDEKDPWSRDAYVYDYANALAEDWTGMSIAVPKGCFDAVENKEEYSKFLYLYLEEQGFNLEEVELQWSEYYDAVHWAVFYAEAAMSYDGRTDDPYRKEAIEKGNWLLHPDNYERCYVKALKIKSLIQDELNLLLREYDGLLVPEAAEEYQLAANLTGLPFLVYPCKTPVTLLAGANKEKDLILVSKVLEHSRGQWK